MCHSAQEGAKNMFYCEYCVSGVNMPYTSSNGGAYGFFAFNNQKDRDRFVKENEYYNSIEFVKQ